VLTSLVTVVLLGTGLAAVATPDGRLTGSASDAGAPVDHRAELAMPIVARVADARSTAGDPGSITATPALAGRHSNEPPAIVPSGSTSDRSAPRSPVSIPEAGAGAARHPSPRRAPTTVSFSAPFTDPGTRVSGVEHCGPTQPGVCSVTFHGDAARFTGPLNTVVDYHGEGYWDPIAMSMHGESWDHHVGSLDGCGTGSFVMHQTDMNFGPFTFDTGERAFRLTLRWELIDGTGDFAGATGAGTGLAYVNSAGFSDNEPYLPNYGTYSGTVTCPATRKAEQ
jgi:hypothetical protein